MSYREAAFPVPQVRDANDCLVQYAETGMTLRDYFAGQALVGLATLDKTAEYAGAAAYEYADAMLRRRAK